MQTKALSPRARVRKSMFAQYGARGSDTKSNRWLAYSVKTNRDWIFPSDRQLVHWLMFLETDPAVQTFNAAPDIVLSVDDKEVRATELDAEVVYEDGHVEWHEVKSGSHQHPSHRSQLQAQAAAASAQGIRYRIFDDEQLQPLAAIALRWLTATCFAAAIRDHPYLPAQNAIASYCYGTREGTVAEVLDAFSALPEPVTIGVLVRLAIKDVIAFDLKALPLGRRTPWKSNANTH